MRSALWLAALLTATGPAHAHAFLEHSDPRAAQVLATSPRIVTLDFSESLEPAFSDVTVTDASGHAVTPESDTVRGTRMSIALPALKPGIYKVTWHALSVDTHRTEGSFSFIIKP